MKKIFFVLLLITQFVYPQAGNKGKISLMLDGELIEAPVTSIVLRKEDDIILSARAEVNETNYQKQISLEIVFKGDTLSNQEKDIRINIRTANKFESTGKELLFHYPPLNDDEVIIRYSTYKEDQHTTWEFNGIEFEYDTDDPVYKNGILKISGRFHGTLRSNLSGNSGDIKIQDGKFEISI